MDAKQMGIRIKQVRLEKGLVQKDIADQIGVAISTIQRYENGAYDRPKLPVVQAIARALDVDPAWLVGKVDERRSYYDDALPSNVTRIPPLRSIPLIGCIACGTPILAAQNIEANIFLPETVNADYALRCKGDSMTGADILDGDIVYIRQDTDVINGQIYAVMVGEGEVTEATLKHVYQTPDTLTLTADNPAYPPMIYQGEQLAKIRIIGKAVGFTRQI